MSAIFYDVVLYGCKTQKDYNSCSIWQTQTILCGRTPTFCSDLVKRCTDISYMPTKKICLSFGHQKFREKGLLNWKWNIFAQTMRKKAKNHILSLFSAIFCSFSKLLLKIRVLRAFYIPELRLHSNALLTKRPRMFLLFRKKAFDNYHLYQSQPVIQSAFGENIRTTPDISPVKTAPSFNFWILRSPTKILMFFDKKEKMHARIK